MRKTMLRPRMTGTRVGGCSKFAWMPWGGSLAGIMLKRDGIMLLMMSGSGIPRDMILTMLELFTGRQE